MAADTTTLALLREARERLDEFAYGMPQDVDLLSRIGAHLEASEGAGVEWTPQQEPDGTVGWRGVVYGHEAGVWRSSDPDRTGAFYWFWEHRDGYAPTVEQAKAAALAAAGVR
jgi:hypothetical protein